LAVFFFCVNFLCAHSTYFLATDILSWDSWGHLFVSGHWSDSPQERFHQLNFEIFTSLTTERVTFWIQKKPFLKPLIVKKHKVCFEEQRYLMSDLESDSQPDLFLASSFLASHSIFTVCMEEWRFWNSGIGTWPLTQSVLGFHLSCPYLQCV
jgi:hypothetical protein